MTIMHWHCKRSMRQCYFID